MIKLGIKTENMKLKIGEKMPLELRTAISIFLKGSDYAIVVDQMDTPRRQDTIKNFMAGTHEIISQESLETAEKLVEYAIDKAEDRISKLKDAASVIQKYKTR